ncbi:cystinosin homolog [Abrus precatorius]|uniref:Cystinosin homolog n=1 Tax=Abrus precatorius TaxID=3816 RepID=A0A8B8LSL0_ABRPR|nr:cystinosin homolog [Abrus precatorius]
MDSWHSEPLHVSYEVVGWFAFVCWSLSFYPQVILNFHRKSVVGLNFDYAVVNLMKQTSYLIYNASLYLSSTVQKQYKEKYGQKEMIPVAANDVAFSAHAVLITAITVFQIAIYERGGQKVSKIAFGIVLLVWLTAFICFFIALPKHRWLWLVSIFNFIQICLTIVKYIPQAVMNFMRKSTDGWSVGFTLLDFSGGLANYAQMVLQSIDQGSWKNIYGNVGKLTISLVSVFFDIIFMCQHFLLYPSTNNRSETSIELEDAKSSDQTLPENV